MLWIFFFETSIITILIKTICVDKHFGIQTPNVDVLLTRFAATALMHMELIEDVRQGVSLMQYLHVHAEEFDGALLPFLYAFLQCLGGLSAEIMNLLMCASRSSVHVIITFFVAVHALSAIDKIYLESVADMDLLETIEEPLHYKRKTKDVTFESRPWSYKIVYVVWQVFDLLYNSVYYYYLPFFVNFVPYFFAEPYVEEH